MVEMFSHRLMRHFSRSITQKLKTTPLPDVSPALKGLTGGQIFHEMMVKHQVKHIFGYPGGAILPVFDAIHQSKQFQLILPRHEQGAGHMAEGYARSTGKPGVVLVTSGPGATNVITPMQDALSDGIPLVVFSGQVPTSAIGTDAFQEADIVGISRHCTKWNCIVKDIRELPRRISEAFRIASSGRPGPVLVDLPKDVTASVLKEEVDAEPKIPSVSHAGLHLSLQHRHQTLDKIHQLLQIAKRPVLYVGAGVLNSPNACDLLKQFSEQYHIPVTTTLQAMGAFDELHPNALHMLGMHGSAYANLAMQNADLILSLGARFDDRVTGNLQKFAPEARRAEREGRGGIVHFDISPKNINKVVQVTHWVDGDVGQAIQELLEKKPIQVSKHEKWFQMINEWKEKYPFQYEKSTSGELKPQQVLAVLNRLLSEKMQQNQVSITTGVGQHQMFAAQFLRWRHPHSFISSGGLGTMGYGLPAAIGAKVATPDRIVIDIDGDASFSMTAMELMTARQFGVGVKVLILNNRFQGMVRQWQDLFYEQRYSSTQMQNPDFVKLAESMDCRGLRIETEEELEPKLRQFLFEDEEVTGWYGQKGQKPVVLDCLVEPSEHVYPMVPAGRGLHEMVISPGKMLSF